MNHAYIHNMWSTYKSHWKPSASVRGRQREELRPEAFCLWFESMSGHPSQRVRQRSRGSLHFNQFVTRPRQSYSQLTDLDSFAFLAFLAFWGYVWTQSSSVWCRSHASWDSRASLTESDARSKRSSARRKLGADTWQTQSVLRPVCSEWGAALPFYSSF